MKYFLIAGEPSGDQHGSELMKAIRLLDPAAEFRFLGGDLMEGVGGKAEIHISDLAFMGFTQLISKVFRIIQNFQLTHSAILSFNPDVVVPIDYGGFNLRLIKWLKKKGFRTVYYITPKVWAWMPSRARILARFTDRSLCVLPFEADFLDGYGVKCDYVGNPVRDYVSQVLNTEPGTIRAGLQLDDKPVIALLPGSRRQEISRILPVMAQMAALYPDYRFVIGGHRNFHEKFYQDLTRNPDIRVLYGKTLELVRIADAALVTSGTATLETALLGTPQVVCYSTATLSWLIARMVIRVNYISLVNLILDRPCIEELIQFGFNSRNLSTSLDRILNDPEYISKMKAGYREMDEKLGNKQASATAAGIVCQLASGA